MKIKILSTIEGEKKVLQICLHIHVTKYAMNNGTF